MSRIQEGYIVRYDPQIVRLTSRDPSLRGRVLEYSPAPGVELDVLVSWGDGRIEWEPAGILEVA